MFFLLYCAFVGARYIEYEKSYVLICEKIPSRKISNTKSFASIVLVVPNMVIGSWVDLTYLRGYRWSTGTIQTGVTELLLNSSLIPPSSSFLLPPFIPVL